LLISFKTKSRALPMEIPKNYRITKETCLTFKEKKDYSPLIKVDISPEFFMWRYLNHPLFKYGYYEAKDEKENKLTAVFLINKVGRRKELLIIDLIGKKELSKKLFLEIINIAKKLKVDFIASVHTPGYTNRLQMIKLGFIRIKKKNFLVLPLKIELENIVNSTNKWKMVLGIHDAI